MQNNKNRLVLEQSNGNAYKKPYNYSIRASNACTSTLYLKLIPNSAPRLFYKIQILKVEPVVSKTSPTGLNTLFKLLLDENLRENFLKGCRTPFSSTPSLNSTSLQPFAEKLIMEMCENGEKSL